MERFSKIAAQALNTALESPIQPSDLETPPDPNLGDFAFPCFRLAKQYRKAPPQIAADIAGKLKANPAVLEGLEVAQVGPYVNFTVPAKVVLPALLSEILRGEGFGTYGKLDSDTRGTWVLEYSSPNVAKPFQIYHLRPTALGAALDRVGRYRGFKVVSINHLGDWGTQYGKLAVAFQLFGKDLPKEPTISDLVDIYVRFHQEAEKNPELEDRAREAFLKLENNDPEMITLWKRCVDISMKEFLRIYDRIGVKFDHIWGESFYKDMLDPLLKRLREKNLLVESEGAWIVPVEDRDGKELPPCILQKKDGATIYATRDVAAAIYRYEKFQFDRMTYIVGGEQRLHFQQVFGVLRKDGREWESRCEHVPTGLYRFKDAKMSTRKGNFVTLEDVLSLAKERVQALMKDRAVTKEEKAPSFTQAELEEISELIAVGAVTFHDLHTDPARDVEFDLERVVDFEGETGPYLQYAHTRCLSILRKAAEQEQPLSPHLRPDPSAEGQDVTFFNPDLVSRLKEPQELALVKTLGQFPIQMERTLSLAKASQLAHYLIDVTRAFGSFYRECRVLGEDPQLTQARLMLVEATRRVLGQGLTLMGVPLPEKM